MKGPQEDTERALNAGAAVTTHCMSQHSTPGRSCSSLRNPCSIVRAFRALHGTALTPGRASAASPSTQKIPSQSSWGWPLMSGQSA